MAIRYSYFPRTEAHPSFITQVVSVFERHVGTISTDEKKGPTSDDVLRELRADLVSLGFEVEAGKRRNEKILRPVFFGEDGEPDLQYEIDAWHPKWRAVLEVEAGRALLGNAMYRDMLQALVMVEVDHLLLAVPNLYHYKTTTAKCYAKAVSVAQALYGHSRIIVPYRLCVIGY